MNHWLARLCRSFPYEKIRRPRRAILRLEHLEDRLAPATITVTTTADDLTPNDGSVSLREAITAINAGTNLGDPDIIAQSPGAFGVNDTINFNIPGTGVRTINVGVTGLGALPAITKPVTINGYSEPGASANTLANGDNATILIELNGANAGANANGVTLGTGSAASTIRGLAINRFSANGIVVMSNGSKIAGNFVGTNPAGTVAEPNQADGIRIANASNNTIGGTTPDARNVSSGNGIDGIHIIGTLALPASGNLVQGNFVGVNAAGTGSVGVRPGGANAGTAAGNFLFGIEVSGGNGNTIGGTTAAARNVVGLNIDGIEIDNGGQNNLIQGNFSGVGADAVTPVGNIQHGVALRSADNLAAPLGPGQANEPPVASNVIGGIASSGSSPGNLVEFNGTGGIAVFGNPLQNNAVQRQNSGNSIEGNSIFQNGRSSPTFFRGIDLTTQAVYPTDDGLTPNDSLGHGAASNPNNFQNFPVLTSVTRVSGGILIKGTLAQSASPATMFRIEFFASNPDPASSVAEGQTFIGTTNVTTNASGLASFSVTLSVSVTPAQIFTATATNLTPDPSSPAGSANIGNTSEFSAGLTLPVTVDPTRFPVAFGAGTNGVEAIVNLKVPGQIVDSPSPIPGFGGEIHRATGDVDRDGVADVVWAAGPGGGPRVRVISGANGAVLGDFFAFDPSFTGGVYVAVADVNGDGTPDIIVGAGAGGGPHVKVVDGTKLGMVQANGEISDAALLASFFAYDPAFRGGVTVASGDINSDGHADVITAAGPGGGPHVKIIDGTKLGLVQANGAISDAALLASFFAYDPSFRGGVFVAAGDFNGDGIPDIIVGAGAGGGPHVKVIDGSKLALVQANGQIADSALLASFFAYDPGFQGGVRVDAADVDGDGLADVVTGAGPGGGPHLKVFHATDLALLDSFFAQASTFSGGVFV